MEKLYTAKASTKGGRNGHVSTSDGVLDLELRTPGQMGGEDGYTNPEQLFAAGYAACFDSALTMLARKQRMDIDDVEIIAEVSLVRDPEDGGFRLEADLTGVFPEGISQEQARELMEAAHNFCPYSKAIKGNVTVTLHEKTQNDRNVIK